MQLCITRTLNCCFLLHNKASHIFLSISRKIICAAILLFNPYQYHLYKLNYLIIIIDQIKLKITPIKKRPQEIIIDIDKLNK